MKSIICYVSSIIGVIFAGILLDYAVSSTIDYCLRTNQMGLLYTTAIYGAIGIIGVIMTAYKITKLWDEYETDKLLNKTED